MRLTLGLLWLCGCAGTTAVQQTHPLIAAEGAEKTQVYFIRPDPGFLGMNDRPAHISLGGSALLDLAKGQYTVLSLRPGSAEMKIESYTVAGPQNTITGVSTTRQLTLAAGTTQYLLFELVPQGGLSGYVVAARDVSREQALALSRGLNPIGAAIQAPLQ
ncbi:MAG TPA: hypothetical protein VH814_06835 [Steroidobacteraceae bacterium]|jgi:hypothetical protein